MIFAVPHAGRVYPASLLAASRLPAEALLVLEDRHADLLVADVVDRGATVFVARLARAWMDLNRDPREIDPAMIADLPDSAPVVASAKVRGGLGLVPRRAGPSGEIWRDRPSWRDIQMRLMQHHGPWHAAIAGALAAAHTAFGTAILIDCHSMPSLPPRPGETPSDVVLGDRFGRGAGARWVEEIAGAVTSAGFRVARNMPYAGGYTVERHGRPIAGIHAVQVEVDRRLYLAADGRSIGPGVPPIAALFADIGDRLSAAILEDALRDAAE